MNTPSEGGRPSGAAPVGPSSSGKRKHTAGPGLSAKRTKAGPDGGSSGARRQGGGDAVGGGESQAQPRTRQERHHQREPAGSASVCSGPADMAGVAGMLLSLQQNGAQPPRGGQPQAGGPAATLQPTPSQQWQEHAGGGRRGAAIFTQQTHSQAGPSAAGGGLAGRGDVGEAQPTQGRRVRPPRQQADFSSVPDPEGAPGAGTLKRIEVFNFMVSAVAAAIKCCFGARGWVANVLLVACPPAPQLLSPAVPSPAAC